MYPALRQLQTAAATLGISLTSQGLILFDRYARELLYWRARLNLTGAATPAEIIERHFIDSLLVVSEGKMPAEARVIDVGTGAGLPGVVVRIVRPDLRVVLLESSRRKVAFLEHLQHTLGLDDLLIEWGRAEDLAHRAGMREAFDVAVTRATARLAVAAELCLPFVLVSGAAICLKGPKVHEEVDEARGLIAELGARVESCELRILPETELRRAAVVLRKERSTPERFPRPAKGLGRRR